MFKIKLYTRLLVGFPFLFKLIFHRPVEKNEGYWVVKHPEHYNGVFAPRTGWIGVGQRSLQSVKKRPDILYAGLTPLSLF